MIRSFWVAKAQEQPGNNWNAHISFQCHFNKPVLLFCMSGKDSLDLREEHQARTHYLQGGTMKKLYILLGIPSVILAIIVAGMVYTAHFTSTVDQPHTAPGA